ncbi:MAG: nucleotidyl transferase AbiEii/AbiGii toxin family protein [Granulosicoccus sp.]
MGAGSFSPSKTTPKLRFKVSAEDDPNLFIKLKLEITIKEIKIVDAPVCTEYSVDNPWFSGKTAIQTFTVEELLTTKLCALLQRDNGRYLFELGHAMAVTPALNLDRVGSMFEHYLVSGHQSIERAEAERRMLAKFTKSDPFSDIRALLPSGAHEFRHKTAAHTTFLRVFKGVIKGVIEKISGQRWARTDEIAEKLGLNELVEEQ